jgi:hypothetical protein
VDGKVPGRTAGEAGESKISIVSGDVTLGDDVAARGAEAQDARSVIAHAARKATALCFIGSPPRASRTYADVYRMKSYNDNE